ncbi:histidine kinase [Niabella sp. W65]|nr:histidine kinase [Niabella sp. W65]MCH7365492.1 histidine kinase [Niabella sp. W65]ULT41280.1 histidine kinase [Niabella sp. I65]
MPYFLACVSVRIFLLMVIAYLNLHYFLPRYLLKQRYMRYIIAVISSVAGYLALQSLFDYYLYGYILGPVRNSHLMETLSYNFFSTLWYLGLMLALKLSIDWYEQQSAIQQIKVEKLNAEVDFLRSQVNPHFLFNALNNLYGLTLKQSPDASAAVLKLSGLMEYMLYDSNEQYIPLDKELAYIHNYIELERLRLDGDADIQVKISGATDECLIPPFLILPLLENAVKHGLKGMNGGAFLHLEINIDKVLEVKLSNSKFDNGTDRRGGIGLENLRKRLELLYPGRHELYTRDDSYQFLAILKIVL